MLQYLVLIPPILPVVAEAAVAVVVAMVQRQNPHLDAIQSDLVRIDLVHFHLAHRHLHR